MGKTMPFLPPIEELFIPFMDFMVIWCLWGMVYELVLPTRLGAFGISEKKNLGDLQDDEVHYERRVGAPGGPYPDAGRYWFKHCHFSLYWMAHGIKLYEIQAGNSCINDDKEIIRTLYDKFMLQRNYEQ